MLRSLLLCCAALLVAGETATPAPPIPPPPAGDVIRLPADPALAQWVRERIHQPMHRLCAECHANGKDDGGFRIDTYERILAGGNDYFTLMTPADARNSPLMKMLRWELGADLNMPPKQRPPPEFVADVERWIALGMPWPVELRGGGAAPAGAALAAPPAPPRPGLLARLHPAVVHVPLGAVLVALLLELVAWSRRRPAHPGTPWTLALAALGAALAVATGLATPAEHAPALRERHELAGWIAAALLPLAFSAVAQALRRPAWR